MHSFAHGGPDSLDPRLSAALPGLVAPARVKVWRGVPLDDVSADREPGEGADPPWPDPGRGEAPGRAPARAPRLRLRRI